MAIFEARISHIQISFSPFSTDDMMGIGNVVLDHIVTRIKSVKDATDSQAKPLKPSYAQEKAAGRRVALGGPTKYKGKPQRDWWLRGRTLGSCKVKFVSEERVTIGPTMEETAKIMAGRNRIDKMWGMSPSDEEALLAVTMATIRRAPPVKVVMMGAAGKQSAEYIRNVG